jgi:hypothetical protein
LRESGPENHYGLSDVSSPIAPLSGQLPYLVTRAGTKVFWFFSSEKNTFVQTLAGGFGSSLS